MHTNTQLHTVPTAETGTSADRTIRRRAFLATAAVAVGGSVALTGRDLPAVAAPAPAWPGHKPGKVYFGVACGGDMAASVRRAGGEFGANRTFYQWDQAARETKLIGRDHAAGRLPWVSFKPPSNTKGIFRRIASGAFDSDIRARARRYAKLRKPVIVTFNHEPQTDLNLGSGADWAAAWCHIHDVMKDETNLKNVASVPILGEWIFNPTNKRDNPAEFAPRSVLQRSSFLGIDLYQNNSGQTYATRLERIVDYCDDAGFPKLMVGVGETAAADNVSSNMNGATWWRQSWNWVQDNRDRVGIVCYFDREKGLPGRWHIDETVAKRNAIRLSRSQSAFL